MAVPWTSPDLAARYSSHVEELRDFFVMQHLHYGTPEDIGTLAARLDSSSSFREDLSSMVRVILLREGRSVPRTDLLEIVIVAIGGADIDDAPQEIQQTVIQPPVQQIFAFLSGVLRKPWNEPPGEERFTPEPIPNPIPMPIPIRTSSVELAHEDTVPSGAMPPTNPIHAESEFSEEDNKPPNLLEEKPPAPTPDFVRPESVYSRFTNLVAGIHTLTGQIPAASVPAPAAVPETVLAREPEPSPESAPPIAQEVSPPPVSSAPAPHPSKVVPWPRTVPEIQLLPPILPVYSRAQERSHDSLAVLLPPIPVSQPDFAAESHPEAAVEPEPPSALPATQQQDPNPKPISKPAAPLIPASHIRIALISGTAATLFVAALMVVARHTSSEAVPQTASSPHTTPVPAPAPQPPPNNIAADIPPATPAAPTPAPAASPNSAPVAHTQHGIRNNSVEGYDSAHDIAAPWSTPVPSQLAVRVSAPAVTRPVADPNPSPSTTISARAIRPEAPSPDATRSAAPDLITSPRHVAVVPADMAGNVLFAPRPDYPMLAKIAHIQGQVVVQAVVDRDGDVSAAHALSGHRLLRSAAVVAALRRHYRPYIVNGHPVAVSTTITFDFGSSTAPVHAPAPADRTSAYADIPPS